MRCKVEVGSSRNIWAAHTTVHQIEAGEEVHISPKTGYSTLVVESIISTVWEEHQFTLLINISEANTSCISFANNVLILQCFQLLVLLDVNTEKRSGYEFMHEWKE